MRNNFENRRKRLVNGNRRRPTSFERLEDRQFLDVGGISALLTLSFAPDGTDVSGHASRLHSTFSDLGPAEQWKSAITSAFHTWAKHTNADIGVVPDDGVPFGTPERSGVTFGDVRIAAAPLAEDVLAIALPSDNLALGSWASDIVFNSQVDWTSIEQLSSVALHEAGHVFGLEHSEDPTSVMHVHGATPVATPSTADIANLQFLYGQRNLDNNESDTPNDSIDAATSLASDLSEEMLSLSFGDISSDDDVDFYRVTTEDDVEGAVRIVVDNRGVSVADFEVKLYDDDGHLLESLDERNEAGIFAMDYEFDDEEIEFFISVALADDSTVESGGYVVAVALDPEELEDDDDNEEYDDLDEDEFRFIASELDEYLLAGGDFLFQEDMEEDDELETARSIEPRSFNAGRTWFEQVGSISGVDVDVYRLQSPEDDAGLQDVMTVRVQAITNLALAPELAIRDESGNIMDAQIIRSGNGEHIVQISNVAPDTDYFIQVSAEDPDGPAARGNYRLSVNFGNDAVQLDSFAEGTLSADKPLEIRELYVAAPQLFHFVLSTESDGSLPTPPVRMELFDQSGALVHTLTVNSGQTRSSANPLLQPGAYTLRVSFQDTPLVGSLRSYRLSGFAVSNPFGVVPVDPTEEPIYRCDGLGDQFCYPGGTTSESPFIWDDFIRNYIETKQQEQLQAEQQGEQAANIWDWFWLDTGSANSNPAPTTGADTYRVRDRTLIVGQADGLLQNDKSAGNAPMIVRVDQPPQNGSLDLSSEGNFRYTPDAGFWGTDIFTYRVFGFDSNQWSSPTQVSMRTHQGGDANSDGAVNFADFLEFARGFGGGQGSWQSGDFDGNGVTDFTDFLILTANFGRSVAVTLPPPPQYTPSNANG